MQFSFSFNFKLTDQLSNYRRAVMLTLLRRLWSMKKVFSIFYIDSVLKAHRQLEATYLLEQEARANELTIKLLDRQLKTKQ